MTDPSPRKVDIPVAHVTFEVSDDPEIGKTFALIAGEAVNPRDRRPLFSAHIPPGMARELRKLADVIEPLEPQGDWP